jgi:hypothetical protein
MPRFAAISPRFDTLELIEANLLGKGNNMKLAIFAAALSLIAAPAFAEGNSSSAGSSSGAIAQSGVNIQSGKSYRQVGAAIPPGLAASGISCQGSASAGVGGSGFGVAFGFTKMDNDCTTRENAKIIWSMGERAGAREVMCDIAQVRAALLRVGRPCIADMTQRVALRKKTRK